MYDEKTIENNFRYHKPTDATIPVFQHIRETARKFAHFIFKAVPESAERTLAFRKLEESVMWANAGLARDGTPLTVEETKEVTLTDLGFVDEREKAEMICQVKLTTGKTALAFNDWKTNDGTKEGLAKIIAEQ
jgi:hypothetical protein